jgi:hypothetical protein
MVSTAIRRRLERLEEAAGGDGGCERCRGLLTTVSDAITGEFHSANWNGEAISEGDAAERLTETKCPRCGSNLDPEESPVIRVGGHR